MLLEKTSVKDTQQKIYIYRGLAINNDDLDTKSIGSSWTLDIYYAYDRAEGMCDIHNKNSTLVISSIVNIDDIDKVQTFAQLFESSYEKEYEIVLKEGTVLQCEVIDHNSSFSNNLSGKKFTATVREANIDDTYSTSINIEDVDKYEEQFNLLLNKFDSRVLGKTSIQKTSANRRQDDSLYVLRQLIRKGYDKGVWSLHEDHPEYDICDTYDGQIVDLKLLISNLKYEAPIFEMSHPNCLCRLICYSSTDEDLEHVVVDWKGTSDMGRVTDKKDKRERSKDFYRLYNEYREKINNIRTNKYLTGKSSDPDSGIYTFNIVLDSKYYYDPNLKAQISDELLQIVLQEANRLNLSIEDVNLVGDEYFVQLSYPLTLYDFSKTDLMDITWSLKERRKELQEVMQELDTIKDWLKNCQNKINQKLINMETNKVVPKEKKVEQQSDPLLEDYIKMNKPNITEEPTDDRIRDFDELKRRLQEINNQEDEENKTNQI
jgi:hypothetical protein